LNKKTNKIDNINNILIIRLSSIGDIVLTSPIIRSLRQTFPQSQISYITFSNYSDIIRFNPQIDNKIYISKNDLKTNFSEYAKRNQSFYNNTHYDIIIDLHNNRYSKKIITILKYDYLFKVHKQRLHKLSLVYLKKPLIKDFNVVENYFASFDKFINVHKDNLGLEFWFDDEQTYLSSKQNYKNDKIVISIAPGAAHKTKQWLAQYFVELIQLLDLEYKDKLEIRLLGSHTEKELADYIEKNSQVELINFVGKTSLVETAKLIDQSTLMITNDTGLMHIAAARQTPIVAIFGSSVQELGFAPYRTTHSIVEKQLWCRPCSHIGRNHCPLLHFNCMKLIKPQDVFSECKKLIQM